MLHIFTYGAGDISRFEYLKSSADFCNLPINYITQSTWSGYFDKVKYMLLAIKNLPDNDIVCFVDGFDVIATGGLDEIRTKFLQAKCDLLVGGELNCWPGYYLDKFPKKNGPTGFKFLNSGGFIGYKFAVLEVYTWKSLEEIAETCKKYSDQGYFIEYYLEHLNKKNIKMDTGCQIFQNMFSVDWNEIYIKNGRAVNSVMNTQPCFFHYNGDSLKTRSGDNIMPIFVEMLNLSNDNSDEIYNFRNYPQNFSDFYFKRSQLPEGISKPFVKKAICILCIEPSKVWMELLRKFTIYDVYMVCDSNKVNFRDQWSRIYPNINFVQILNSTADNFGFKNSSSAISPLQIVNSWDKAVYYFSKINLDYDNVWLIEDDVYFHNEQTLLAIDEKYPTSDLLSTEIIPRSFDMSSSWFWHWSLFDVKVPEPHFRAWVCASRISRRLFSHAEKYARANGSIFYIEAFLPTLAKHHKLQCDVPEEMDTVKYRHDWHLEDINNRQLYHPMKNLQIHEDNRLLERFN